MPSPKPLRTCFLNRWPFEPSKPDAYRYEKSIEGNVVQLDLLADLPRRNEDESLVKIPGTTSSLQHCLADGGEDLGNHIETIQIHSREGESLETFEITSLLPSGS